MTADKEKLLDNLKLQPSSAKGTLCEYVFCFLWHALSPQVLRHQCFQKGPSQPAIVTIPPITPSPFHPSPLSTIESPLLLAPPLRAPAAPRGPGQPRHHQDGPRHSCLKRSMKLKPSAMEKLPLFWFKKYGNCNFCTVPRSSYRNGWSAVQGFRD